MKLAFSWGTEIQGAADWPTAKGYVRQSFEDLVAQISSGWTVNHFPNGTHNFTAINANRKLVAQDVLANAPNTLGTADQGFLYYISDYGHTVYWTGTVWIFAPGDLGNGFIRDYCIVPQENGWHLCDGGTTTYLVVGSATLSTASITLPNLTGTAAYRKTAGAYTGVINPAGGVTGTASTSSTVTGTDVTGTGVTGTGTTGLGSGALVANGVDFLASGVAGRTIPALTIPALSIPALTIPALAIPALGVGSIDMPHIGVLPYFRR